MKATSTLCASAKSPFGLYRLVEEIAKQDKVSPAWVMRDTAMKHRNGARLCRCALPVNSFAYLNLDSPLLPGMQL